MQQATSVDFVAHCNAIDANDALWINNKQVQFISSYVRINPEEYVPYLGITLLSKRHNNHNNEDIQRGVILIQLIDHRYTQTSARAHFGK